MRIMLGLLLIVLTACGQKGPLYIPGPAETTVLVPSAEGAELEQPLPVDEPDGEEAAEPAADKDKND